MGSYVLLLLPVYVWACVTCAMVSATVPGHDAAFLSLLFQTEKPRLEVFLEANGRVSIAWNTSLLDLLFVYRVARHSSICKVSKNRKVCVNVILDLILNIGICYYRYIIMTSFTNLMQKSNCGFSVVNSK